MLNASFENTLFPTVSATLVVFICSRNAASFSAEQLIIHSRKPLSLDPCPIFIMHITMRVI